MGLNVRLGRDTWASLPWWLALPLLAGVLLGWAVAYALTAAAWIAWASIILPAAGVAWLLGRKQAARALGELVMWDLGWLRR